MTRWVAAGVRVAALAAAAALASGCVSDDPFAPRPIQPWPPEQRVLVDVAEMKNEAPSPEGAAITVEATVMLRTLLARSERFVIAKAGDPQARYRLVPTLVEFADVDAQETIVFEKAQSFGRKREALVEVHYALIGLGGKELESHVARGTTTTPDIRALPLPEPQGLATGAFWHTEFGRATRQCLDEIVRDLCIRVGPEAATGIQTGNPSNPGA